MHTVDPADTVEPDFAVNDTSRLRESEVILDMLGNVQPMKLGMAKVRDRP